MATMELLTLDLRSPLPYSSLGFPPAAFPGDGLEEGEEELFLFEEEELVAYDPDEGPILRRPLPRPDFYGRRAAPGAPEEGSLAAGTYVFLQWRPRDEAELLEGLEWFAKQAWWERAAAGGPYIVRRLREDGRLATQALRKIT